MQDPLSTINTRETPQSQAARADQVENSAGGFVFGLDDRARALRFLILGTEGGTYYTSERELTKDNAGVILRLAENDGEWLVDLIRDVSLNGRAPKQNATLLALAACAGSADEATRRAACAAIPAVCRTGTMLFIFCRYVEQFRGWGRALRRSIGSWYQERPVGSLAYQAVKYRQREGWSHRDLLRLSHPEALPDELSRRALYDWIVRGTADDELPLMVQTHRRAMEATTVSVWAECAAFLPWEALPDEALKHREVWEAMLPDMGPTALIRNLGRLTNLGVIAPLGGQTKTVVDKLTDAELLQKGRVHPLQVLVAASIYGSGHGLRGSQSWQPNNQVVGALTEAFYMAFGAVEPAGKRTLLGLDVSGSMASGSVAGSPLRPYEAEGAMAMLAMRTEPEVYPMAFSSGFVALPLTATQRLDDVLRLMGNMPFESTDCSVPMRWAERERVPVDTFIVYTDNETWSGREHPFQALRRYRDSMGIAARLIVVGMTSTGFTIADPTDRGMLDVVGFDTAAPNVMAGFSRGDM
jgi:60 kDa SS-A/Ro ribonucleoprotein